MFTASVHDAARAISPSARGELEITDAIQHLVDSGRRVEPHIVEGWWKDTGQLADMLEANRLILDTLAARCDGELDRLPARRPRRRRGGRAARALDGPRPGDHRRRRAADRRLRRPLHRGRRGLRDRVGRGRALDPARRLRGPRPRRARRVLAARAQRADRPRRRASRAPTASCSATTPRCGSRDAAAGHRRRRDARPRRRRRRRARAATTASASARGELDITDAGAVARGGRPSARPR